MADATELEYVGFWLRVWAAVIDSILVLVVTTPLLMALHGSGEVKSGLGLGGPVDLLISWVLPAAAVIAFWVIRQATPGKMAISAKIVDARTGRAPTLKQDVVRYLGYFVSTVPFLLGLIWVGLDKRKQGWHDKLAGTVVVRPKRGQGAPVRFGA